MDTKKLTSLLPERMKSQVDAWFETLEILTEIRDPRILRSIGPSGVRGLVLQRGKQGVPTKTRAHHDAHFDWAYPSDNPEMRALYGRAKRGQWDAETKLAWSTSVDPFDPERPLLPEGFLDFDGLEARGIKLDSGERARLMHSFVSWLLSQFLHGEQGALIATAKIVQTVPWAEAKFYAANQVADEARHVEVYHRYLTEKLGLSYEIEPSLGILLDQIVSDSRWDITYLGMQILVEGLALAAFGFMHMLTQEPLLKKLLRYVMSDEARHVAFGVLSLQELYRDMSDAELRERQEFAFDAAVRLQRRFRNLEVWERMGADPAAVTDFLDTHTTDQADEFQTLLFSKIVPNCKKLGLLDANDGWLRKRFDVLGVTQFEDWVDTGEEYLEMDAVAQDRAAEGAA